MRKNGEEGWRRLGELPKRSAGLILMKKRRKEGWVGIVLKGSAF